jgi:hypothetical protein
LFVEDSASPQWWTIASVESSSLGAMMEAHERAGAAESLSGEEVVDDVVDDAVPRAAAPS